MKSGGGGAVGGGVGWQRGILSVAIIFVVVILFANLLYSDNFRTVQVTST